MEHTITKETTNKFGKVIQKKEIKKDSFKKIMSVIRDELNERLARMKVMYEKGGIEDQEYEESDFDPVDVFIGCNSLINRGDLK